MNNQIEIEPLVDAGYVQKTIANGQNAVFKNGRLVYIILDVDKPGKYFFDLRDVFNASTGEGGKDLKILFMNNNVPFDMNGKTVSIAGIYPNRVPFHVTGAQNQASSSLIDFVFPLGLFQQAGIYKFQFKITDESQNQATSHYCFFQVTQNSTLMAVDYNNGVNPFDSDYNEWKAEVDNQIKAILEQLNSVNTAADGAQSLLNSYINKAQSYVEQAASDAINKLLTSDNTWSGNNTFNGSTSIDNLTIGSWFDAKKDLTVEQTLHVKGAADLPASTTINSDVLQYENGNLAQGLFPCEGYWFATSNGQCVSSSLINGATGYISCKKFRYTPRDGDAEYALMEYHMNCNIPTSAFGKPVVQFAADFGGVDQTPFILGGHVFQLDAGAKVLKCNGYATGYNSTTAMDAAMV